MIFLLALIGAVLFVVFEAVRDRQMSPLRLRDGVLLFVFLFFFITGVLQAMFSVYQVIAART